MGHQVVGMQVQNMGRSDKKDKGKNTKLNLRVIVSWQTGFLKKLHTSLGM